MPFYFLCVSSHYILTFLIFSFFFFNDTATTEIYTLSLHDALPIFRTTAPSSRVRRWTSTSISGVSYLPPESGDVLGIGIRIIRVRGSRSKLLEIAAANTMAAFGVGAVVGDGSVADCTADSLPAPARFQGGFRGVELGVEVNLRGSNQLAQ